MPEQRKKIKAKEQYDIEIIEKQNREKYNPKFLFNRKEVTKYHTDNLNDGCTIVYLSVDN